MFPVVSHPSRYHNRTDKAMHRSQGYVPMFGAHRRTHEGQRDLIQPEVQPEFSRLEQPASVLALQVNIERVKLCAALHDVCQVDSIILFLTIIR